MVGRVKRRIRATQRASDGGLGLIPKNDPETCRYNFNLSWRGWFPRFGTPRGIIWMGTWRTLHSEEFYMHHVPLAYILVFHQASLELRSGAEYSANWETKALEECVTVYDFLMITLS